jgi:N-glycosylase/DNA lyase
MITAGESVSKKANKKLPKSNKATTTMIIRTSKKMNNLIKQIKKLEKTVIKNKVKARLKEFDGFKDKDNKEWFSELCFCLLTANSKARTAIQIQNELGPAGFCSLPEAEVRDCIVRNKHRFHNNKARFIVLAREHAHIRDEIICMIDGGKKSRIAREWLVKNIKGLGYKEASHFLRNVSYDNLAILDRHILNLLVENGFLREKPKSLDRKSYLEIEEIILRIAKQLGMTAAELDLYLWYMKGGDVLK